MPVQARTALPGHSLPTPSLVTANPKKFDESPEVGQSRVGRAVWPQERGSPSMSSCSPTHGHSFITPRAAAGSAHFHDNRGSVVSPQFEPSAPLWQEQSPGCDNKTRHISAEGDKPGAAPTPRTKPQHRRGFDFKQPTDPKEIPHSWLSFDLPNNGAAGSA